MLYQGCKVILSDVILAKNECVLLIKEGLCAQVTKILILGKNESVMKERK